MKIIKYINDKKWEIDVKQDYKHKTKPINPLEFYDLLNKLRDTYIPGMDENLKNMPPNMSLTRTNVEYIDLGPIIPESVMLELTKIFQPDPTYPIHIKMLNEDSIKYTIHIKKDGSCKLNRFIPNNVTIEPVKPKAKDPGNRHWL